MKDMNPSPAPHPQAEALHALCTQFQNTRHDLNNVFSVLIGLAELGAINPVNFERLGEAVLDRCPKVLADLQRFQEELFALRERSKRE